MPNVKSFVILFFFGALCASAEIRLGIIGTDTSHVIAFTKLLNDSSSPDHVPGARVVAAYKGGSPDIESSDHARRQVRRRAADEVEGGVCVRHSGAVPQGGRRAARKRRRPRAPGAGAAGDRGAQAGVHRQAAGLDAGGRARNRPPGQGGRRAVVQLLQPALRRHRQASSFPIRPASTTWGPGPLERTISSICPGTPSIPSSCCTR